MCFFIFFFLFVIIYFLVILCIVALDFNVKHCCTINQKKNTEKKKKINYVVVMMQIEEACDRAVVDSSNCFDEKRGESKTGGKRNTVKNLAVKNPGFVSHTPLIN